MGATEDTFHLITKLMSYDLEIREIQSQIYACVRPQRGLNNEILVFWDLSWMYRVKLETDIGQS